MTEPRFVHLRVHSDYSMIDGLAKTGQLVKKAAELGMPALAITDFTNLCGFITFYETAHCAGIKPIIGADFNVHSDHFSEDITQLTVLAMNNTGYKNLTLLISRAYQQGYGTAGPVINRYLLSEFNEGLLLISGGCMGDIGRYLLLENNALVEQSIKFYDKYFKNRFYINLVRTGRNEEDRYINAAVALAISKDLPLVVTNDVRFINSKDFKAHEIRVAIHNGVILNKISSNYSPQQYMRSEDEMCKLFADIPEALKNSVEIAKRCNVILSIGEYFLPKFPTGNMTTEKFLVNKSKEGLEERLKLIFKNPKKRIKCRSEYDKRLDMELQVINKMGFPGYFLTVMEFIHWAKNNGVPVGPGRGSGAGSLVAYSLKITDLDPLKFNLLFERFLNPERVSMPDIDVDFCMDKRDLVIEHVADMYGQEAVSQIITFGTLTAKAVIRDVGRVLGYPYSLVNRISKLIPIDSQMTLTKAFEAEPKLLEIYKTDEEVSSLIDIARKLEGVIRNVGKHAGGVVIAPTKITDFTPLYCDEFGQHPVTQFDKNGVEYVGLVKFDFLGLRTLTIINAAIDMINKQRYKNNESQLDIAAIPLDDKKSFEMLKKSETTAVFQLESRGMKDLIKRMQPDSFEDIIALVALFRPGPLQSGMVDNFINRKHGIEQIYYPDVQWQHESLKSILEPTYGIILYQEQVMQIARVLSGYTLGGADMLRRAMCNKKPEEMAKQRSIFEEGAIKNGIDGVLAIKIFDILEKFAGYGFNKSHSAAYALITYQTLWLKAHYPAEYMAAVMTAYMDNTDKLVGLIDECWKMGIKIMSPDINLSLYNFQVNNNGDIVYGIGAIKGIGKVAIETIINARNKGGLFIDLFDLCLRVGVGIKKIKRNVLEKLILAGALDKLGPHRAALINSINNALKAASQQEKAEYIGQADMFEFDVKYSKYIDKSYCKCQPWSEQVVLEYERETLGLYFTGHPINQYLKEIEHYVGGYRLKDISTKIELGKVISVAGLVIAIKYIITKRGNNICICILDDRSGRIEVIFSTKVLYKYQHMLEKYRILIVCGQLSLNNFSGGFKIIAQKVMDIYQARKKYISGLAIYLTDIQIGNKLLIKKLRKYIEEQIIGTIPIHIYHKKANASKQLLIKNKWYISTPTDKLLYDLGIIIGNEQVELMFD